MITVIIEAQVPDDKLLFAFLDWVRVFDKTWPGCHFRIAASGGDARLDEVWAMFERLGLDVKFAQRKPPS